ncbi:MAG: CBS domain-containing protein [Aigarchaeota archaeon]|nr:CBS domain-containing protein [Candidatus Pelearchaeum maunauluense]
MHIASLDTEAIVVASSETEVHGIFTGYNFISLLTKHAPEAWTALYKTACYDVDWKALATTSAESLTTLLATMGSRRWGYAIVMQDKKMKAMIGVLGIARFFAERGVLRELTDVKVRDIASKGVVMLDSEATISEAMETMLRRGVRRIIIPDENKVITDRDVTRYLLSGAVVEELRNNPNDVFNRPISEMRKYTKSPATIDADDMVSSALSALLKSETYTALTEDWQHILTPWDLTIKLSRNLI